MRRVCDKIIARAPVANRREWRWHSGKESAERVQMEARIAETKNCARYLRLENKRGDGASSGASSGASTSGVKSEVEAGCWFQG